MCMHAHECVCVCVFTRAQCTCFVFHPWAYHEMSCQTFPAIECEQDCSPLYTLTVCPSCCAGCKRVFEVQSTTSAIKLKPKEEPLWIYDWRGGGEPGGSRNPTSDVTQTMGTSMTNKSSLKIYSSGVCCVLRLYVLSVDFLYVWVQVLNEVSVCCFVTGAPGWQKCWETNWWLQGKYVFYWELSLQSCTCVFTRKQLHTHKHMHSTPPFPSKDVKYAHTVIHANMHTQMNTHTDTDTHTHTHTHTHIHKLTQTACTWAQTNSIVSNWILSNW